MPTVVVTLREGAEKHVKGDVDQSLMEAMRDGGIDEIFALCGGVCSCATCHVFVDQDFFDKLPPMSENENELLESSEQRRSTSRLSCQIALTPQLDGLRVTVAPED